MSGQTHVGGRGAGDTFVLVPYIEAIRKDSFYAGVGFFSPCFVGGLLWTVEVMIDHFSTLIHSPLCGHM